VVSCPSVVSPVVIDYINDERLRRRVQDLCAAYLSQKPGTTVKQYTLREIMYELKKLRIIEMNNGKLYLTEISKRQRELFNKFEVEIPSVET
jgi:hypothetical protein